MLDTSENTYKIIFYNAIFFRNVLHIIVEMEVQHPKSIASHENKQGSGFCTKKNSVRRRKKREEKNNFAAAKFENEPAGPRKGNEVEHPWS